MKVMPVKYGWRTNMSNALTKEQLCILFKTLESHRIPITPISYYTEQHDMIYFFDQDDRIVMMIPKQDWLDIVKYNDSETVKE